MYADMNQKRIISRLSSDIEKICDDIRMLTEHLLDAYKRCEEILDTQEREETRKILNHMREDFEGYFKLYIDRRKDIRAESLFQDMLTYFGLEHYEKNQ